ncbi:40S ribosomal protein s27-2 [Phtheirospermum japonicum]|uniref:40S ribosomal protein s27-2 n=1 Tax=Phtheirospermum japonicum TaxID=374723 RepID=A0A830DCE6_9LAMI|nr:40S ribosomal protein s27-2 [Phtheirospermum japonicum]
MDVKCQDCYNMTTIFSRSHTVVVCGSCQTVMCQPTGGRARLTERCSVLLSRQVNGSQC